MTFYKKWLLKACLLLFPFLAPSQSRLADSLISLSKKPGLHDTVRCKLYGDIAWELISSDISKSLSYARKELDLAVKNNRANDIGRSESDLGTVFSQMAMLDSALLHHNKALKIAQSLKKYRGAAGIYVNIAVVYARQSKLKEALDINFKALKLFEQTGDTLQQTVVQSNIGIIYQDLGNVDDAEKFFLRSLSAMKSFKGKGSVYMSPGGVLMRLGAVKAHRAVIHDSVIVDRVSMDSSFYYFDKAEAALKAENNLMNLAIVHAAQAQMYVFKGDPDKAIGLYGLALKEQEAQSDQYGIAHSYSGLGEACLRKKEYARAEEYYNRSNVILSKFRILDELKNNYRRMTEIAEAGKDYARALQYHQLYTQYKDSMYTEESTKQIAEMQTRYDTEKKDLEIAKKGAELKTREEQVFVKNMIIIFVICLLILSAIAAYFFYRKKQLQQKAERDAELARQKDMRARAVMEAEEKERIRIAKDLHDGVGQLLSAARLNLSTLGHQLGLQQEDQKQAFKNALTLVDDSVKEVRVVSHNMMPNTLLKLGLASAVKEFITRIQTTPNLKVNLEIVGMDQRLEQEKETVLYRAIQELVSNIIKHAKATELTLQLIRHENELSVVIEDNGVGFDASKLNNFDGMGLKNILSRVEFINGTVRFDSAIHRGTTVLIDIPVMM